jgi:hypothetical protein
MGEMTNAYHNLVGKREGEVYLEDLGVDVRVIITT